MKIISGQKGKLEGKKILLRLDLNVPIEAGKIVDNFKIEKALTTLNFLQAEGAKVIILSHLGRGKTESLLPVCEYLNKFFKVVFIKDIFDEEQTNKIKTMSAGEIVLLENLRQFQGEEDNDSNFAKKLAVLGDIYVNEAFATSHRSHSSIVGLPKLMKSYLGPVFANEIEELTRIFQTTTPRLIILGGSKLKTKLPFIRKFLKKVDNIFIGGALANEIFKAQGLEVGQSLVSGENFDLTDLLENRQIILPKDVVVEGQTSVSVKKPQEIFPEEKIVDIGPEASWELQKLVNHSKFILWNGPLGNYERGFSEATFKLIQDMVESRAVSVVGGGETEHCISQLGLEEKFDFISTGGGAMLEFLATGTLVGIEAIKSSFK